MDFLQRVSCVTNQRVARWFSHPPAVIPAHCTRKQLAFDQMGRTRLTVQCNEQEQTRWWALASHDKRPGIVYCLRADSSALRHVLNASSEFPPLTHTITTPGPGYLLRYVMVDVVTAEKRLVDHLVAHEEREDLFAADPSQSSQESSYPACNPPSPTISPPDTPPASDGNLEANDTDFRVYGNPHPPSLLTQFPLELLTHIFALACDDGGFTGRSLSLVSRAFRAAAEPIMFRSLHLTTIGHICWLAQRLSIDPLARFRVFHPSMDIPDIATDLKEREADWGCMDGTGRLVWDSNCWEPLYGDYIFDSDDEDYASSESSGDVDTSDIAEDLAFFASDEGQKRTNVVYTSGGTVVEGTPRWPVDIGLENAQSIIVDCISSILSRIHAIRTLKLYSAGSSFIFLPHLPEITELDIDVPFLVRPDEKLAAFPTLKRLCLRGRKNIEYINVDTIILHAPVLTHLRMPFSEDLLHALISALSLFPDSAHPIGKSVRRFEHIKRIILEYHYLDLTAEALTYLNGKISNVWKETISMTIDSAIRTAASTWGKED